MSPEMANIRGPTPQKWGVRAQSGESNPRWTTVWATTWVSPTVPSMGNYAIRMTNMGGEVENAFFVLKVEKSQPEPPPNAKIKIYEKPENRKKRYTLTDGNVQL